MSGRVGILGGTFDPIHRGHVDVAEAAERALNLSALMIIPLNTPPHRPLPVASGFHRFAMAALAVAGRRSWRVSDLELMHAEPSYTTITLDRLHRQGYAPSQLVFVVGVDAFLEIRSWKDYPNVLAGAQFAVVSRPGFPVGHLRERLPELAARMVSATTDSAAATTSIILVDAVTTDVSATAIRQRCADGRSLAGLVPHSVEQHIEQHGLYRSSTQNAPVHRHATDVPAGRLHGQS